MANDWLELNAGGVPVSFSFKFTLDDLRGIAEKSPESRGINRQLELCLVGLVSYFEGFCKDLFGLSLNVYPELVERLSAGPEGRDVSIDPMLAVVLGDALRDKLGFILSERYNFGSAKDVNALYGRLLKFKPFDDGDKQHFDDLLRDRNLIVHHGSTYTYRYLRQANRDHADAHWMSLVVDRAFYFRHHDFIERIARKLLTGAYRELTAFGKDRYGFQANAPVEALLDWDPPEPEEFKPVPESKSLYAQMLEKKAAEEQAKLLGDDADAEEYSEA